MLRKKGLFRYPGEKILLSDEGVQQLGLGYIYLTRSPIHPSTDGQKSWGRLNLCREELRNPPTKGTKVFRHRNVVGELPLIPPAARMGDYSRIRTQHCI